jgi:hypothetical protein
MVGAAKQSDGEIDRLRFRSLEIDNQLDLRYLLHGKVCRFFPLEDAPGILSALSRRRSPFSPMMPQKSQTRFQKSAPCATD